MDDTPMSTVEEAVASIRQGRFAIVVDDFDRENEGDFIGAAELATPARVASMLRESTGVVCATMGGSRARQLELPLMVPSNEDPYKTAFTVTVDYACGTTTGISASDRAATLLALATCDNPAAFSRPGHVFPLIARPGGVLERGGHTEASVDLCKLSGLTSVGYICELCDHETYEMLRLPALVSLATRLSLPLLSIADLQRYRLRREVVVDGTSVASTAKEWSEQLGGNAIDAATSTATVGFSTSSLGTMSDSGNASVVERNFAFSSRFNDNSYTVTAFSPAQQLLTEACSAPRVRVYVHFDCVCGGSSNGERGAAVLHSTRQSFVTGATERGEVGIVVNVFGDVHANVRGKGSSVAPPERKDAAANHRHVTGSAHAVDAAPTESQRVRDTSAVTHAVRTAPRSAYEALYPVPTAVQRSMNESAGDSGGVWVRAAYAAGVHSVCDRVNAEIGQSLDCVFGEVLRGTSGCCEGGKSLRVQPLVLPADVSFSPPSLTACDGGGKGSGAELTNELVRGGHSLASGSAGSRPVPLDTPGAVGVDAVQLTLQLASVTCADGTSLAMPMPRLWEYSALGRHIVHVHWSA